MKKGFEMFGQNPDLRRKNSTFLETKTQSVKLNKVGNPRGQNPDLRRKNSMVLATRTQSLKPGCLLISLPQLNQATSALNQIIKKS